MTDHALFHLDFACRHIPFRGRRGDQHHTRRRADLPHLFPRFGHRGRPASGHNPEQKVLVELRLVRRKLEAHDRPVSTKLFGHQRRHAGGDALAHLEMLADERHRIVGSDFQRTQRLSATEPFAPTLVKRRCAREIQGSGCRHDNTIN